MSDSASIPQPIHRGMVKGAIIGLVVWLILSLSAITLLDILTGSKPISLWDMFMTWKPTPPVYQSTGELVAVSSTISMLEEIATLQNYLKATFFWCLTFAFVGGNLRQSKQKTLLLKEHATMQQTVERSE